ncbi:hypothetical protein P4O66_008763 [Electrophorus voltai]|uniref:Reverse transcriptase n=1 Tax=Electrophorus voltai TaxID=2609070 RepID=A0AAD8ZD75_9TELE|nr:hypothetical protein P4O66_008763 [Electrophorus voltai]
MPFFFRKPVNYLGHVVSENGVGTDPGKIAALITWPRPNNLKELKSFLRFTGYYRRFVKDYSKISKPLKVIFCRTYSAKAPEEHDVFSNA